MCHHRRFSGQDEAFKYLNIDLRAAEKINENLQEIAAKTNNKLFDLVLKTSFDFLGEKSQTAWDALIQSRYIDNNGFIQRAYYEATERRLASSVFNRDDEAKIFNVIENARIENNNKRLLASYIIRFDNKGYRCYDFNSVRKHFQEAKNIQWLECFCDTLEFYRTNNSSGKSIHISIQTIENPRCYLCVQDDNDEWVEAIFSKMKEHLTLYKNKNWIFNNWLTPFIIQILGVVMVLFFGLWGSINLSPLLKMENAFAFTFIISFLFFSNIWTFIYMPILKFMNYVFPVISFKEKNNPHWIIQTIIGAIIVGILLYNLSLLTTYFGQLLQSILK